MEKKQKDGIDRGEIKTVFSRSHSDIQAGGKRMCDKHIWKKLSENEVACIMCPTVWIVNADVLDELLQ